MVKVLRYYHAVKSPGMVRGVGGIGWLMVSRKLSLSVLHTEEVINAVIRSKSLQTYQAGTADY